MENKKISFLLGAGFSKACGLPLASDLTKDFVEEVGRLQEDVFNDANKDVMVAFIFEKILAQESNNYEIIFDLLQEEKDYDKDALREFVTKVMEKSVWEKKPISEERRPNFVDGLIDRYLQNGYEECVRRCIKILHGFILDKLTTLPSDYGNYNGFITLLKKLLEQGYIVNIFSLNHDLVLEELIKLNGLTEQCSDGFCCEQSEIKGKHFRVHAHCYHKQLRVVKLHGSIDTYETRFDKTDEKKCVKVVEGYSKENALLVDFVDKMIEIDTKPLFLTGVTSKEKEYAQDEHIRNVIDFFESELNESLALISIGYSGNDPGINDIIFRALPMRSQIVIYEPIATIHPLMIRGDSILIKKGVEDIDFCVWKSDKMEDITDIEFNQ